MFRLARLAYRASVVPSLGLAAWLAATGCSGAADRAADSAGATGAAAPATVAPAESAAGATSAGAATLNDAQIAHVAVTANALDSAAAVMAKEKGASQAVKDFAQTMITDHAGVNRQAVALATRLNVTPEDNDVSRQLKAGGDNSATQLRGLSGAAFDRAYMDHEVAYHQAVLDALDQTLIPGAQNAELKKLLQDARPAFVAHLDRAKGIQGSLARP